MITAKVIGDSYYLDKYEDPHRVTTLELEYPRYIHSELLTHRVFSRNSASSRAIPIEKMIELLETNPVIPEWTLNQKGMSGEKVTDTLTITEADKEWDEAKKDMITRVRRLMRLGIHKQNANRLLEPFQHIKTVITGTDWQNFYNLRISEAAQPEMKKLAVKIRAAIEESTPYALKENQVHLPYIDSPVGLNATKTILKSVALCAQVSYRKEDSSEETVKRIINRLLSGDRIHASPFEHICIPDPESTQGNLKGFTQLRHCVEQWKRFSLLPDEPNYYECLVATGKKLWNY